MDDSSDEDTATEAENHSEGLVRVATTGAVDENDEEGPCVLDIGQRDFDTSLCQTIQQRGKISRSQGSRVSVMM